MVCEFKSNNGILVHLVLIVAYTTVTLTSANRLLLQLIANMCVVLPASNECIVTVLNEISATNTTFSSGWKVLIFDSESTSLCRL